MVRTNQSTPPFVLTAVRDFMQLESAGGILSLAAAGIAMLVANSPLAALYDSLLDTIVAIQIGALSISKPLLLWINDGLMAVFFTLPDHTAWNGRAWRHGRTSRDLCLVKLARS